MRCTRPDIRFALSRIAEQVKEPSKLAHESLLNLIDYLNQTKNYKFKIQGEEVLSLAVIQMPRGNLLKVRKVFLELRPS